MLFRLGQYDKIRFLGLLGCSALARVVRMVWSPSRVVAEVCAAPNWFGAYLLAASVSTLVVWIGIPVLQRAALAAVAEPASQQGAAFFTAGNIVYAAAFFGALFSTAFNWFCAGLLLWLIVQVFGGLADFKLLFALVAHAHIAPLTAELLTVLMLLVKAQHGTLEVQDLSLGVGLDAVWQGGGRPALRVVLSDITPFKIWYYGLLALGVKNACRFSWLPAAAVVALLWGLYLLFAFGAVLVLQQIQL